MPLNVSFILYIHLVFIFVSKFSYILTMEETIAVSAYLLVWALLTIKSFDLAQSLRVAINNGDTVRPIAKAFTSIFCIIVGLLFMQTHLWLDVWSQGLVLAIHLFIIGYQMVMIWYPKPE